MDMREGNREMLFMPCNLRFQRLCGRPTVTDSEKPPTFSARCWKSSDGKCHTQKLVRPQPRHFEAVFPFTGFRASTGDAAGVVVFLTN